MSRRRTLDAAGSAPCPGCRRWLPIRDRQPDETGAHWECAFCHARMTGVLLKDAVPGMAESIRISQIHFDTSAVEPLPDSLRRLVKEFVACRRKHPTTHERRSAARVLMQLDVTVVPLDERWTPIGKPGLGLVVDLASNGLGMVTPSMLESEHLALQMRRPTGLLQILGRVAWTRQISENFHNSGVQFLLRFGRSYVA